MCDESHFDAGRAQIPRFFVTDLPALLEDAIGERYRITGELGRGGMATVYLALDRRHNREVAIKVFRADGGATVDQERFLREITLLASLQHPHILPLHDSGAAGELLYYVMPAVLGESVRARLDRERRLAIEDGLRITREVCDALGYAHERGVVHRDIKPENILLSAGHAMLADFGIASVVEEVGSERLTRAGTGLGTPAYMSPEQATGDPTDGRSDLYSLGCLLFEMLSGSAPFPGTGRAVIMRHMLAAPPDVRTFRSELPGHVALAIMSAMGKSPDDRPANATAFLQNLSGASLAGPVQATVPPRALPSIAVFDFRNISGEASADWLGAGIAETVSVDLKKLRDVVVIGRDRVSKAMALRPAPPTSDDEVLIIARDLGARWALWGGVQALGPSLRFTPRVIDVATGVVRGAEKIDGPASELFALQDRIVLGLMDALELELSTDQLQRIARPETDDLEAYECCVKGRQRFNEFTPAGFEHANRLFERAIEIDPLYALAYSGLGSGYVFRYIAAARPEDLALGVEHLERATALDPDLDEPWTWLTYGYMRQHRYGDATRAGERAARLDPHSNMAHYFLGAASTSVALHEHRFGSLVDAARSLGRAIELQPRYQAAYNVIASVYMANGEYVPARTALTTAMQIEEVGGAPPRFVGALSLAGMLELRSGADARAQLLLQRAAERYGKDQHVYAPAFTAVAYCGLAELSERRRQFDVAVELYGSAIKIAHARANALGFGFLAVRATLGMSGALASLGMRVRSREQFDVARELFDRRDGYNFEWIADAFDGRAEFEFARFHAAGSEWNDAVDALTRAVESCWGDLSQLDHDPYFAPIRHDPALDPILAAILSRGTLPGFAESGRVHPTPRA
ncbi:MAG: protein kinase [Gemmatimonadaceae bacterium]